MEQVDLGEVIFLTIIGIASIRLDVILDRIDHHLVQMGLQHRYSGPSLPMYRPTHYNPKRKVFRNHAHKARRMIWNGWHIANGGRGLRRS